MKAAGTSSFRHCPEVSSRLQAINYSQDLLGSPFDDDVDGTLLIQQWLGCVQRQMRLIWGVEILQPINHISKVRDDRLRMEWRCSLTVRPAPRGRRRHIDDVRSIRASETAAIPQIIENPSYCCGHGSVPSAFPSGTSTLERTVMGSEREIVNCGCRQVPLGKRLHLCFIGMKSEPARPGGRLCFIQLFGLLDPQQALGVGKRAGFRQNDLPGYNRK